MCVRFTEKYLEFARECIPTKTITIRDRDKPWFNSGIKREMKIRDSLHKKMRKQPNINNICKYKVSTHIMYIFCVQLYNNLYQSN
jgi:hypothetical protein